MNRYKIVYRHQLKTGDKINIFYPGINPNKVFTVNKLLDNDNEIVMINHKEYLNLVDLSINGAIFKKVSGQQQ